MNELLLDQDQLTSGSARREWQGCAFGIRTLSLILVDAPAGERPRLDGRPYEEVMVVHEAEAVSTIGHGLGHGTRGANYDCSKGSAT